MTEFVSLSKVSKMLGVTTKTLRNWDELGKIKTVRTSGNHRRVSVEEVARLQGKLPIDKPEGITIAYCRTSTKKQEENLERQVGRVLEYCVKSGWRTEILKDIGSGLNENRKNFKRLLKLISEGNVSRVVLEYKDRIARYGFETFRTYCESFGTEIIIMQNAEVKGFEEEMVEDIIALVASYSAKMYGRRGGKKK